MKERSGKAMDKKYYEKARKIYELMWPNITNNICKTWTKDKKGTPKISNYSYSFSISDQGINNEKLVTEEITDEIKSKICNQLINIFKINNKIQFRKKFFEACSGNGTETVNLIRLHSSALCALLFFYEISKNKPLTLKLNEKSITFNNVFFEYKNKVINGPSNIDIVLISEEKKKILFLESKFSEYYLDNKNEKISSAYLKNEIGELIYLDKLKVFKTFKIYDKNKKNFILSSDNSDISNEKSYVGGIKQMVSHYIGLMNFIDGNLYSDKEFHRDEFFKNNNKYKEFKIYLGEILFDFNDNIINNFMLDYEEKYKVLAKILKNKNPNINFLPEVLHYSKLLENNYVNPTIKAYYSKGCSKK